MSAIKLYQNGSNEYKKLELAAAMLTYLSPNGYRYYVGETYFDYGQDWMWTTVLCDDHSKWGGYQALCPREQEEIVLANGIDDIKFVALHVLADKYCPDRKKTA